MKQVLIEDIEVNIVQKRIKNIHLRIYPPLGEVRLTIPRQISIEKAKTFIISKLDWIKKQQIKIRSKKILPPLQYLEGEVHYFFGEEYILKIFEKKSAPKVFLKDGVIELHINKDSTLNQRKIIIDKYYRLEMNKIIPQFIFNLEKKMNVKVAEFGIKKMKTRWGTCNIRARRIWLNLELAKKPISCLEYIIVHEMVHLLERKHSKKFIAYMDNFLPSWRNCNDALKL